MKNRIEFNIDLLSAMMNSEGFESLDADMKKEIIKIYKSSNIKERNGFIGRIFGSNSKNISLYIAFIITVLLILVGLIYIFLPQEYKGISNAEFWNILGPIISSCIGYIFGANVKK